MTTYDDVMKTVMDNYGPKIVDNIVQTNPMLRSLKELADDYARRDSIFGHGCKQGGLFTPNELSGEGKLYFIPADVFRHSFEFPKHVVIEELDDPVLSGDDSL